jgi:hypothetical protein
LQRSFVVALEEGGFTGFTAFEVEVVVCEVTELLLLKPDVETTEDDCNENPGVAVEDDEGDEVVVLLEEAGVEPRMAVVELD